jgi:predicted small secreted protein
MRVMLLALLCTGLVLGTSACGTVKGLGEDISSVGGWFVKGSDKVENAN